VCRGFVLAAVRPYFASALARATWAILAAGLLIGLSACSILPTTRTGPTVTPGPSPTPTVTVIYQNALTSVASDWSNDQNCSFASDGYHIKGAFICLSPAGQLTDTDIKVQASQISGPTLNPYGIALRRPSSGNRYEFDIDGNSKWVFFKCVQGTCSTLVDYTANAAIAGGLNASNTLEVIAVGSHFDLFVNGTKVGAADDTTFASGEAGLSGDDNLDVVFTNFSITKPR
jgi:hypothetical protein